MNTETRQKLFNYMSNEHGLHLLENELDEIERILGDKVEYAKAKCKEQRTLCANYYMIRKPNEKNNGTTLFEDINNAPTPDFE